MKLWTRFTLLFKLFVTKVWSVTVLKFGYNDQRCNQITITNIAAKLVIPELDSILIYYSLQYVEVSLTIDKLNAFLNDFTDCLQTGS